MIFVESKSYNGSGNVLMLYFLNNNESIDNMMIEAERRESDTNHIQDFTKNIIYSMSQGLVKFSSAFKKIKPDLLVVLGDRYEIFAASCAAMFNNVPIAHIHGGEVTEGMIDEAIRHSITKMAHIHFTSTEEYKRRVIQMGEDKSKV